MRPHKRNAAWKAELAKILLALIGLGLIWVATQSGLHNWIGRQLIAPLAPKH